MPTRKTGHVAPVPCPALSVVLNGARPVSAISPWTLRTVNTQVREEACFAFVSMYHSCERGFLHRWIHEKGRSFLPQSVVLLVMLPLVFSLRLCSLASSMIAVQDMGGSWLVRVLFFFLSRITAEIFWSIISYFRGRSLNPCFHGARRPCDESSVRRTFTKRRRRRFSLPSSWRFLPAP